MNQSIARFVAAALLALGLFFSPSVLAQASGVATSQPAATSVQATSGASAGSGVAVTGAAVKSQHRAKHPLVLFWLMLSLFIIASLGGLILVGGLIVFDNPLVTRIGGFILIGAIPLAFVCFAIGYLIQ